MGLDAVCGLPYDTYRKRTPFEKLLAVNPDRRFRIGDFGGPTMRIVELFAPLARGTRGLIVAPPRTGKTVMLEELAKAICAEIPDSRVVVLLVDERAPAARFRAVSTRARWRSRASSSAWRATSRAAAPSPSSPPR
ncbi:MAG: hypothetical protein IPH86_11265 [bacterium]|nr:hypothetical protein [bacterium]